MLSRRIRDGFGRTGEERGQNHWPAARKALSQPSEFPSLGKHLRWLHELRRLCASLSLSLSLARARARGHAFLIPSIFIPEALSLINGRKAANLGSGSPYTDRRLKNWSGTRRYVRHRASEKFPCRRKTEMQHEGHVSQNSFLETVCEWSLTIHALFNRHVSFLCQPLRSNNSGGNSCHVTRRWSAESAQSVALQTGCCRGRAERGQGSSTRVLESRGGQKRSRRSLWHWNHSQLLYCFF